MICGHANLVSLQFRGQIQDPSSKFVLRLREITQISMRNCLKAKTAWPPFSLSTLEYPNLAAKLGRQATVSGG